MPARKVAPALAAGCAMVLKPAEQTPFSALALAALAEQAGAPPGVLNVITGAPATLGPVLTTHPGVAKVSFTGSTRTGALIAGQAAPKIKKLALELGGNAPFVVFEDADLDAAVAGALESKFRNAGQTCVCANRIFVQAPVYETFLQRFIEAVEELRVGPGSKQDVDVGPLIDEAAVRKVERHVLDAVRHGAQVATGGSGHPAGARFFRPTVLRDATNAMLISREETFGPVAPVIRFGSEEELVNLANDTSAGLAAYIYSRDLSRVWRIAEALQCGMVGVNTGLISTEVAPFGGVKASGLGREGSRYGLEDFLDVKYVCLAL